MTVWAQGIASTTQFAPTAPPSFASLVERVTPAVVDIVATKDSGPIGSEAPTENGPASGSATCGDLPPPPIDPLLQKASEQPAPSLPIGPDLTLPCTVLGSGFIIDPSGYVVTNNHLVAPDTDVTVVMQDHSEHPATVVGRDALTDLILLKIDATAPLPHVALGDSDASRVGDRVLAVGAPFGLSGTVITGIISARDRDIDVGPDDDFLQIEAAINPGSAGGPTFNLQGQVIGINTAIVTPSGGSVGIGLAIPSNLAGPIIAQLRDHGKVDRGWFGISAQEVTPEIAGSLGLHSAGGVIVSDLEDGSPAAAAGVRLSDVVLSFAGHAIDNIFDLPHIVAQMRAGQRITLQIWRGGKTITLQAEIGEKPERPQAAQDDEDVQTETEEPLGVVLAPLTSSVARQIGLPEAGTGVVVIAIADESPLAGLDIEPGDIIEQINRQPVTTPREAAQQIEGARSGNGNQAPLLVLIERHGVKRYVAVPAS